MILGLGKRIFVLHCTVLILLISHGINPLSHLPFPKNVLDLLHQGNTIAKLTTYCEEGCFVYIVACYLKNKSYYLCQEKDWFYCLLHLEFWFHFVISVSYSNYRLLGNKTKILLPSIPNFSMINKLYNIYKNLRKHATEFQQLLNFHNFSQSCHIWISFQTYISLFSCFLYLSL